MSRRPTNEELKSIPKAPWYTYVYHDPLRGCPMYVGKGRRYRAYSHLTNETHTNTRLRNRLKNLNALGLQPIIEVFPMQTDDAAKLCEIALISAFGRKDLNTGTLYNLTYGGDGMSGFVHSAETKQKIGLKSRQYKPSVESLQLMRERHSGSNNARALNWLVQCPDGTIVEVCALKTWAAKNSLNPSMLYRSARLGVPHKNYQVWRNT